MAESDIIKQIALLNPRIINGSENGNVNEYILNNETSSPSEVNTDITDNQLIENDDDNDILNLWSSTKIFFDPFDPSKINPTTQSQNSLNTLSLNSNNIEARQLSEREIDRQRYNRLKQQQQSIYAQRGRRSAKGNDEHDTNILNKNNLLDINDFQHLLLNNNNTNTNTNTNTNINNNNNNNNKKNIVENSLLQASTSTSTVHSLATTQNLIQNISLSTDDHNLKSNNPLNPINNNENSNKKNKDLYTQLLDSINLNKDSNINVNGKRNNTSNPLSKTNESRSKEIAEKKKRRSAATMRCRERKKNQLQKKEQYIKYLENQILFLNGSILHMSNEITWLRRSFLDQYGEQSLKNIYLKNGFKDINLNNVLYPGNNGTPDFSDFNPTNTPNLLPQELNLNNISIGNHHDLHEHNKQNEKESNHQQNHTTSLPPSSLESTTFLNSLSSSKGHTLTTSPLQSSHSTSSNVNLNSKSKSKSNEIPNSNISSNFLSSFSNHLNNTPPHISSTTTVNYNSFSSSTALPESLSIQNSNQKNIFNQLDMETLNQFANLSKEQRDILLKILEKQQELTQPQKSKNVTTSSSLQSQNINVSLPPPFPTSSSSSQTSRNFINIANDEESVNHFSKPQSSLLNLESVSTSVPTTNTETHFNTLTTNSIFNSFHSQNLSTISFQNTSLPNSTSSILPTTSNINNLNINSTTTASEILTTLNSTVHNSPEKDKSSDIIPTSNTSNLTTTTQQDEYINLENLIYYI